MPYRPTFGLGAEVQVQKHGVGKVTAKLDGGRLLRVTFSDGSQVDVPASVVMMKGQKFLKVLNKRLS